MRQRLHALLVVLTVMMSTIVVASGILHRPVPQEVAAAPASPDRSAMSAPSRNSARTPMDPDRGEEPTTRAPDAAHQDPVRIPSQEPPAPVRKAVPGGVTDVDVPRGLGGDYLVKKGKQKAPKGQATYRVSVEVEDGLPVSLKEFSSFVMTTLNHKKSWAKGGAVTFARTDTTPDLRIILASPDTVDAECAPLATNGKWSCGTYGKAMINAERWINGADAFTDAGGDMLTYRRYVVNHEVGHLLGHQHESCPAAGELAPVMVQQSITLEGCTPNGWAHP